MIYALLNETVDTADREAIAQAIQNREAAVLRKYKARQVITHIMDIQPKGFFYCIYCGDRLFPSPRNPPAGQKAGHPWYFMHRENNHCVGEQHKIGCNTYLNPSRQGCYVQLGCLMTHPHTSCEVRRDSRTSCCYYAFTSICPS